jgi:acyl dehydratase
MTAATTRTLLHTGVAVGDELPDLSVEVTATTIVLGALASRDWRPMHHDYEFVVDRQGTRNIFLNTPSQAAWFERYITDWTGPTGRLGQMTFRMRDSVFPGDVMRISGTVTGTSTDVAGAGWVDLDLQMATSDGRICTTCTARVALPTAPDDNPWSRSGDVWNPRSPVSNSPASNPPASRE